MKKSLNKKSGTLQQTFKHILKHGSQLELQKYSKNSNFDDLFQPIQPFLQQSDENILNFIHYCMIEIKKNNQKNKLVIIYLIHSIFRISSKFRKEFCEHLSDFVTGIGLNSHDSLPISEAKNILLRVIAEWDYEFGKLYPSLRATARYLKETLRLPLPDIRRETQQAKELATQEYLRKRELKVIRIKQVLSEMERHSNDIKNELVSLEECLNLLFPALDSRDHILSRSSPHESLLSREAAFPREKEDEVPTDLIDYHSKDISPHSRSINDVSSPVLSSIHLDLHHLIANQHQQRAAMTESDFAQKTEDDDSEWEDGSIIGESDILHLEDSMNLTKKRKFIDDNTESYFDTIQRANLGNLNYTLEITLPTWNDYHNENKELLFEKIKELSSHLQKHLLPLLFRWSKILSSASKLELSFRELNDPLPPTASLSKFHYLSEYLKINETILENRIDEVTSLIKDIQDILQDRCSLLFDNNLKNST